MPSNVTYLRVKLSLWTPRGATPFLWFGHTWHPSCRRCCLDGVSVFFREFRLHYCPILLMYTYVFPNGKIRTGSFTLIPWTSFFFSSPNHDVLNALLGSTVASTASICLHHRPLRAYAEPRRASARRGEAPLVLLLLNPTNTTALLLRILPRILLPGTTYQVVPQQ